MRHAGRGSATGDKASELAERIAEIEREAVVERRKALTEKPGPSCIIAFSSQYAAACAAQCRMTSRQRDLFHVVPAPGPDDINWQTILHRTTKRRLKSFLVLPLILAVVCVPTGVFTGVISSLCVSNHFGSGNTKALQWYCTADAALPLRVVVQGVLPPILLTLWETFVVSFGMMYLVMAQNAHVSLSRTDQRFTKFYFLWAFANVFFGTVSGFAIQRYFGLLSDKGIDAMQQLIGGSLPLTSNFFLSFVLFRGVYLPSQRLIFPHPGVLCMAVNKWLCCLGCIVTPRDRTVKYSPRSVRMGREVGVFAMILMIGLVFVPVTPIISAMCVVFFIFNFVVWRYHVIYVYERTYEAGGTMWHTFTILAIYALLISQSFTSFVLLSKQAYSQALVLWITVVPVLVRAQGHFRRLNAGLAWAVPLPQAATAPRAYYDKAIYMHPSLKPNAMGWHPEIGKVWRGYPNVATKTTF